MNDNFSQYSRLFSAGARIRVAIPTGDENIFHEWAHVASLEGDLVELQLSRDVLPLQAILDVGTMLELRTGSGGNGFRCRSIIVKTGAQKTLTLRLIGEVILDELREYFRIDVYLPIRLSVPDLQDPQLIKEEWLSKRTSSAVLMHEQQFLGFSEDPGEADSCLTSFTEDPPKAANISGGGMRVTTADCLEEQSLVHVDLFLPLHPPVILHCVAQVIGSTAVNADTAPLYSTAFRFYNIDERDRDRIIQYITVEQLAQLRQYRQGLRDVSGAEIRASSKAARRAVVTVASLSIICLLLIGLASWVTYYSSNPPKSEIHRLFEKGLKEYIERFR